MKTKTLPQLILFDGATGAGKSSLLICLRNEYSKRVYVGAKLTTRQKRVGDNDWEMRFVERIPDQYARYSFDSVGNQYSIDQDQLVHTIDRGLVYVISCVDPRMIEALRSEFDTATIYVYRSWTDADLEALLAARETSDLLDSQLRRDEVASITPQYLEKIEFYDHVILNIGSKAELIEQLTKILLSYGIPRDVVTNKAE